MSEWRIVPIGEVADGIFDGPHATPKKVSSGPFFLSISSLQDGRLDLGASTHISEEDFPRWTRRVRPSAGDLVFSYETRIGQAALIPEGLRCCLGRRMGLVRPDHRKVLPQFLLYQFLGPRFQNVLRSHTVPGSTVERILLTEFPAFPITLPELGEQARIVEVLSSLDDKIELNREMNRTLEALAQAIFRSWFVDFDPVVAKAEGREPFGMDAETAALFPDRFVDSELGAIPEGWEVAGFGDIAELQRVVVNPGAVAPETPYVGLEHIPRQSMILNDWGHASDVSSAKAAFEQGHVLFGKLRPYFHKVVRAPVAGVCSTDVLVIRPLSQEDSGLVLHTAASSEFVAHADAGSSGTRMPRARWEHMQRFALVRPPCLLSARFCSISSDLIGLAEANVRESLTLASLRDLLLPKLLSGEIRVPEAAEMVEDVA